MTREIVIASIIWLILFAAISFTWGWHAHGAGVDLPPVSYKLHDYADRWALKRGLDPEFLYRLIEEESDWDYLAVYKDWKGLKREAGLCQIRPNSARAYLNWSGSNKHIRRRLLLPHLHIRACTLMLRQLMDRYNGDLKLVLAAWNAGRSHADYIVRILP